MNKVFRIGLPSLVGLALAMQVVPYGSADNPPVEEEIAATPEVGTILRRACYDCHSHETTWPWYSQVAPAKWLVRHDVAEGREHLNFSAWNRYNARRRAHKLKEVAEQLDDGKMPPRIYMPLHPEARLTDEEVAQIRAWAIEQAKLIGADSVASRRARTGAGEASPTAPPAAARR